MLTYNQRRWYNFRKNKRGFISFCLLIILLVTSIFAEFIANDKPVFVYYKGGAYFPIFHFYDEKTFGGDFETEPDYKDSHVQNLINKDGFMIFPLIEFSYDTIDYYLAKPTPTPPSMRHILGTDDQARDIFARVLYGFRTSFLFGVLLTISSAIIGVAIGSMQGYFGGMTDLLLQRFTEVWNSLPILFLLIIVSAVIEPSFLILLFIMMLFGWVVFSGIIRAEFFRARNLDYVKAAKILGVREYVIIVRHILPNALTSTIATIPFVLNSSIISLTTLDFLGFGLSPQSASLGELLQQAKTNLHAPWIGFVIFFFITFLLSLLIFISEAVRDAMDARKL